MNNSLKNNNCSSNYGAVTPVKYYENALLCKNSIFTDNSNKSGIYRWVNKLNNNAYVGSGLNLKKRVGEYFNKSELISLVRYFSSTNFPDCFPVKSYENADTDKFQIIHENSFLYKKKYIFFY